MNEKIVTICPACGSKLHIAKLECGDCGTIIEGDFQRSRFERLNEEDLAFIELFLEKRGNIKEVGKALDLSYPTVKNKLNIALKNLGFDSEDDEYEEDSTKDILKSLSDGEIDVEEAIKAITNKEE